MPRSQEPKLVMTPIVIGFLIMIYFYYPTVFETIDKWLGLNSIVGFFNVVSFSLPTAMTILTYIVAIMSDPGTVHLCYRDLENPDISLHEVKKILLICAAHEVFKTQQQTGEAYKISHITCGALLFPLTFVLTMLFLWHI
ncbi:Protein S-acyltransferase protein [Dioscorea alata]|uniref:Protein S-acyltransferase protein n=1 Tax=Dioscorea alata TaxID=55571 RepID=A0ACB7V3T0_DIOAL|nr:Protein S-acyltransferase protein [Dioscorea alata]